MSIEPIQALLASWQVELGPEIEVVLGGSLVSGLFIEEESSVIDVDVRFLHNDPSAEVCSRIQTVTGLAFRKAILVQDWPHGESTGVMIEGVIKHPDYALPLEVEGCLRNRAYVGWARFYKLVLSEDELLEIRDRKRSLILAGDKKAYKAFKSEVRSEVEKRAIALGLV
jgi:hypothetical protein